MGRVGCTFAALLKMASDFEKNRGGDSGCYGVIVAIVAFCIGDCADVRECVDVSSVSSLISGILHD